MRDLWKTLEPVIDSWLNTSDPGELDPSLAGAMGAELPFLDWTPKGSLIYSYDDDGNLCFRCKRNATIPAEFEQYAKTTLLVSGGERIDEKLFPIDSPPLQEYQRYTRHQSQSKIYEGSQRWNEVHDRIRHPTLPSAIESVVWPGSAVGYETP